MLKCRCSLIFCRLFIYSLSIAMVSCGGGENALLKEQSTAPHCSQQDISSGLKSIATCFSIGSKRALASEYWRRIQDNTIMLPQGGFDPRHYPAEVIASVHALGLDMEDLRLLNWATSELDALDQKISISNGFLIWPTEVEGAPTFGELAQSRLVFSLALIHEKSPSMKTKRMILMAFNALNKMPRIKVRSTFTGESYLLPPYAFHNPQAPLAISTRSLDPNHDAALAATYAIVADSVLENELDIIEAKKTAHEYYVAAMDLASPSKCLPLADQPEYRTDCDTRYNSFWLSLMLFSSQRLLINDADSSLNEQYLIIKKWSQNFQTSRTYPSEYTGYYYDPVEPILLATAVARFDNVSSWNAHVSHIDSMFKEGGVSMSKWPVGWLYPAHFIFSRR